MNIALMKGANLNAKQEKGPRVQPEALDFLSAAKQSAGTHRNPTSHTKRVTANAVPTQASTFNIRRPSRKAVMIAGIRRDQITAILRDQNDRGPCRTDDAVLFLDEVLPQIHIASAPAAFDFNLNEWVRLNVPGLSDAVVQDARARVIPNPPPYTSPEIGRRLGLSVERYDRLRLTHVQPAGWTPRKHAKHVLKRKAAARKVARVATGKTRTPRELSVAKVQPWITSGMSRAAFYRLSPDQRTNMIDLAREAVR